MQIVSGISYLFPGIKHGIVSISAAREGTSLAAAPCSPAVSQTGHSTSMSRPLYSILLLFPLEQQAHLSAAFGGTDSLQLIVVLRALP